LETNEARKTPRGARPNRRGEPARLDERKLLLLRRKLRQLRTLG
jgi:hypothetical protein